MFRTFLGPVEDSSAKVYLRPETAQGMFVDFKSVLNSSRKVPFGIAQNGKSFRNEISPGNSIFRTREFEQMEMEFFCEPGTDDHWFEHWRGERFRWYVELGVRRSRLRLRDHAKDELAHYAKAATDVEYLYPFGWGELEGIANRTDFDLRQHQRGVRGSASGTARSCRRWSWAGRRRPTTTRASCPTSTTRRSAATSPTSSSRRRAPTAPPWPSSATPTRRTGPPTPRARRRCAWCCACIRAWRRSRRPSCR